jgi:hypothetical protein
MKEKCFGDCWICDEAQACNKNNGCSVVYDGKKLSNEKYM